MTPIRILHVAEPERWDSRSGAYRPDAFGREGFIHCCTPAQLPGVLVRWFAGHDRLRVLELDLDANANLRWESAQPGGESFPHLYESIIDDWVSRVWTIEARGGIFALPGELTSG